VSVCVCVCVRKGGRGDTTSLHPPDVLPQWVALQKPPQVHPHRLPTAHSRRGTRHTQCDQTSDGRSRAPASSDRPIDTPPTSSGALRALWERTVTDSHIPAPPQRTFSPMFTWLRLRCRRRLPGDRTAVPSPAAPAPPPPHPSPATPGARQPSRVPGPLGESPALGDPAPGPTSCSSTRGRAGGDSSRARADLGTAVGACTRLGPAEDAPPELPWAPWEGTWPREGRRGLELWLV
jgi:hypothetical protein